MLVNILHSKSRCWIRIDLIFGLNSEKYFYSFADKPFLSCYNKKNIGQIEL